MHALEETQKIIPLLRKLGVIPLLLREIAEKIALPEYAVSEQEWLEQAELVLVMGGDGALLSAARMIYPRQTPLCGVNLGHLGFLTEVEAAELPGVLPKLLDKQYQLDSRIMLRSMLFRDGNKICEQIALNDMVVTKGTLARMIKLETYIDGELMFAYSADGLIISTPTGSTAYSLSAGGPVLHPDLDAIVLTPICAHTIFSRPLVVKGEEKVNVIVRASHNEMMLTADGQVGQELRPDDEISVERAPFATRLIRFQRRSFYEIIRLRLREGRL